MGRPASPGLRGGLVVGSPLRGAHRPRDDDRGQAGGRWLLRGFLDRRKSAIAEITKHERSRGEKIGNRFAVLSSRNIYFVQLAPGLIGAVQPPNRDLLVQWLDSAGENKPAEVSEYLAHAAQAGGGSQVIIAVDLSGKLDRGNVQRWVNRSAHLKSREDRNELASLLASLRGIRLSVLVSGGITGRLRLDFGGPVETHADGLRTAVLAWLDDVALASSCLPAQR